MITASDFGFQTSRFAADAHPLLSLFSGLNVVAIPFLKASSDYDYYDVPKLMGSPGGGALDPTGEAGFGAGSI